MNPPEIFENEEAETLLNYLAAYKKLSTSAESFRRAARNHSEIKFIKCGKSKNAFA